MAEWTCGFECSLCGRVYVGASSCPIICGTCGSRKPDDTGKWSFHVVDVKVKRGLFGTKVKELRRTGSQISRS